MKTKSISGILRRVSQIWCLGDFSKSRITQVNFPAIIIIPVMKILPTLVYVYVKPGFAKVNFGCK